MARILIIDDDPLVRRLVELNLTNAGHEVALARDPVEGLKAILGSPPELILLDVQMPYMSGLEVLKAIKSDESARMIPVVMLTSIQDEWILAEMTENGADCCLTKPIRMERILETIDGLLKRS